MKFFLSILFLLILNSQAFPSVTSKGVSASFAGIETGKLKKLLTVGDSVTAGVGWDNDGDVSNDWGYRRDLQDLLGIGTYKFVGSINRPTSDATYDVANWGTSGMAADWFPNGFAGENGLRQEFNRSFNNSSPDSIILIHVGTNDVLAQYLDSVGKRTNAQIIGNINTLIDYSYDNNPNAKILVALIIPDRRPGQATFWGAFHDDLKAALITKQATVPTLVIVDMYEAFINDRYGDCAGDWYNNCMNVFAGDHPSATGYTVMAKQWNACIQSNTNPGCNGH